MADFRTELDAGDEQHVLRLVGDLSAAAIPVLFEGANRLAAAGASHRTATIDLEQLRFLDAFGLRALLSLRQHGFRLCGARGAVGRMIEPFQRRERCGASGWPHVRGERPRDRARSLEQQAQRHELVADRFEVLGEPERAEQARELAAACRAEARRWRLLAR